MQKEINLSAPDKDHIILTKYQQAYLTSVLTRNLSKQLLEKLKILMDASKATEESQHKQRFQQTKNSTHSQTLPLWLGIWGVEEGIGKW